MTDEEKHLSREAIILTGVPMKTNVSSSWLTFIAIQNYSFLNKSVISKCLFILSFSLYPSLVKVYTILVYAPPETISSCTVFISKPFSKSNLIL
jgi:hypothetical protein